MTPEAADTSWHKWISQCLEHVGTEQDLDYLTSLNYSLDQIFSFLIERAGEKHFHLWKALWRATLSVQPSPLHSAVIQMASAIITTNYDTLFEIAANREGLQWNRFILLAENPNPPAEGTRTIWKLHGSFPDRSETNPRRNKDIFNSWYQDGGADETVASAAKYHKWALGSSYDAFVLRFGPLIDLLHDERTLVVFVGLGLGAEELIITRLLSIAAGDRTVDNWIALEVPEELDPLYRLTRRKILPLRVPLGLCGGSFSRALAMFALLERYVQRYAEGLTDDERNRLVTVVRDRRKEGLPVSAHGVELSQTTPLVVSIGQSSINKMIGLKRGVAQEGAYGAMESMWTPSQKDKKRILVSYEVGGQALIPALIWDALGIPCGLVSQVYSDEFGRAILHQLQRADWIDFSGVKQLPKGEAFGWQTPATENATVATWFGVRTILDAVDSRKTENFAVDRALLDLDPSVLYVTKRGWEKVKQFLESKSSYQPLIVFETGGIGKIQAEAWVASREGIVIASAVAALGWMNDEVNLAARSDAGEGKVIQEAWERWFENRRKTEVKDDRGRLFQAKEVLEKLQPGQTPGFLDGILRGLRLYGITLGDLGVIYWVKSNDNIWIGPKWCTSTKVLAGEDPIPDRDVRNGIACGDASRAGFVAALLLQSPNSPRATVRSAAHLEFALAWANWFGACKLQFFSLNDYIAFLRRKATSICDAVRKSEYPPLGESGDIHDLIFRTQDVFVDGKPNLALERWKKMTEVLRDEKNRQPWEERIKQWAKARQSD